MTPTRLSTLAATAAVTAVLSYLLVRGVYGSLPPLPGFAPVPVVLLAGAELGLARVVRRRLRGPLPGGRPTPARPLHPLQVARAAVLAKASSAGGALLFGAYAGLLAHVLPQGAEQVRRDALVSAATLVAALLLVGAALLLERACRAPGRTDPRA